MVCIGIEPQWANFIWCDITFSHEVVVFFFHLCEDDARAQCLDEDLRCGLDY